MPLFKLNIPPGVNREGTSYSNGGGWYDCNLIRFRMGKPERWKGWTKRTNATFHGTARDLIDFRVTGTPFRGIGTTFKYYLATGQALTDITPIRRDVTLSTDPITTQDAGSGIIQISDASHGAVVNDFVTIGGATDVDGITAAEINVEHQITEIVDTDNYLVDTGGSATIGSTAGGGSSVTAEYQINVGLDLGSIGIGWGSGSWGSGGWSFATATLTPSEILRLWSSDNFGVDLVFNVSDGGIYYWDASSGLTNRGVALEDLTGANSPPTVARKVIVSDETRQIICFGCNPIGSATQDMTLIRWSDFESATEWFPSTTNAAGDLLVGSESVIITALKTKQEILVWTEDALFSLKYIGAPFYYGLDRIGNGTGIIGQNAAVDADNVVYWMGLEQFYAYDGRVQQIPCAVREYVFDNLNRSQAGKIYGGTNRGDGEIIWFYPSANSQENDRYVVYNYQQNVWYYGQLARTAWIDRDNDANPIGAGTDGYLYRHEDGLDDGSTSPASAINAYIESSDVEIEDGTSFIFSRECIPDLSFNGSTAPEPTVKFTIEGRKEPGAAYISEPVKDANATKVTAIENYTQNLYIRVRGRGVRMKVESDETGVFWRLGSPRLRIRTDGRQ